MGSSSSACNNKNIYTSARARGINLGGFDYRLRFVVRDDALEHDHAARIQSERQEISISAPRATYGEPILHECLHKCDWMMSGNDGERSEDYIAKLSYQVYAWMRANPELVIRILAEGRERQTLHVLSAVASELGEQITTEADEHEQDQGSE